MSVNIIIALICSGVIVGFINTLAGGGTIISLSLLMFLGLPPTVANGTNRIAVLFQNTIAVANFKRNKTLETKKGLILSIPTIIGSLVGASIAVQVNENIFKMLIAIVMVCLLFVILFYSKQWLKGDEIKFNRKPNWLTYTIYLIIGLYGGFMHVGVGYIIMTSLVLHNGFNIIKANAVKNLMVLLYIPFTLAIFVWKGQVAWGYGLIHAIGNIIGAFLASKYAIKWGAEFVRWIVITIIVITIAHLFNIINIENFIDLFVDNE